MSRMIFPVTIAIVVGSIAASTIGANVLALLAQFPPPIPGPPLSIPLYYDRDDDRLTFRKPESGPYTQPMVMLDVPGDARVDVERDVLAIQPHAWTATQCLILALAHHGEAFGIHLAKPEGQPTMPPPVSPDGPPRPRRGTDRPDAGKRPGPLALPGVVPGPGKSPG
ncbi:MAG TPA: hypothetical protein VKP69_24825 [Isosphaeraceae bacterium]|nr:hypothetical protein [Isosphaeraceae bacterium]